MGLIEVPASYTLIHKVPSYAFFFYAINGVVFALGLMDSMIEMLFGTAPAMIPVLTSAPFDCMFVFVAMCQLEIGFLLYPYEFLPKAAVKGQQLIAGVFMFAFFFPLALFFSQGLMGIPGFVQYGLMNTAFGVVALLNYTKL